MADIPALKMLNEQITKMMKIPVPSKFETEDDVDKFQINIKQVSAKSFILYFSPHSITPTLF